MNMISKIAVLLAIAIILLPAAINTGFSSQSSLSQIPPPRATLDSTLMPEQTTTCLASFTSFAYRRLIYGAFNTTLPLPPWQVEAELPLTDGMVYWGYPIFDVVLSRVVNGSSEVWMSGDTKDGSAWLVYLEESGTWETITQQLADTGLASGTLFTIEDGTLWSGLRWSTEPGEIDRGTVPVLGKFNELTRRFEIPEGMLEVPVITEDRYYQAIPVPNYPEIIPDKRGIYLDFCSSGRCLSLQSPYKNHSTLD